jgi:hypothetical protein
LKNLSYLQSLNQNIDHKFLKKEVMLSEDIPASLYAELGISFYNDEVQVQRAGTMSYFNKVLPALE